MRNRLVKIASSSISTIVALSIYAIALGIATFIEKYHGTNVAKEMFYYAPAMFLLQFFMIVNFIAIIIKKQYLSSKRWGMMAIHAAFIVILCGAFVSHLLGIDGIIHLREGESTNSMTIQTGDMIYSHKLPFSVELTDFRLIRYPGSSSPSSYESDLTIDLNGIRSNEKIYMNNILDIKGYRLFQASYDSDEQGTILSVNKDVLGRNITYTGYSLLILGFLLTFFERNSRFRSLVRQLNSFDKRTLLILIFIGFNGTKTFAQTVYDKPSNYTHPGIIDANHAKKFGLLPMQSQNGRMLPINTFSSELLRKITKEKTFEGLSSDQFLISFLAMPEMWVRIPLVEVSNETIINTFDLDGKHSSYLAFFDEQGEYKLSEAVNNAYKKMANERSKYDKDLLKVDERVNTIYQLMNHQLIRIFPSKNDATHHWYAPSDDLSDFKGEDSIFVSSIMEQYYSEVRASMISGNWDKPSDILSSISDYQQRIETTLDISCEKMQNEVSYNEHNIFSSTRKAYLIIGGLFLLFLFISQFIYKPYFKTVYWTFIAAIVAAFTYHTYGMGLRWYIAGYAPWSNSYETMVYVSWASVLGGFILGRKSTLTLALAVLFGGVILFVSGLSWMDPQISPLVPVLKSPWLMFHVAVVVAAYGFFGICALLGITNLILMVLEKKTSKIALQNRIKELSTVNEISMLLGLALMTIGTFLGAIWANVSWGRYWGWDPKETWALITMVIYAIVTHLRLIPKCKNPWLFNFMSIVAIASVLMTFFGVNYFLSGMHSYGGSEGISGVSAYIYGIIAAIVVLAVMSYPKKHETL